MRGPAPRPPRSGRAVRVPSDGAGAQDGRARDGAASEELAPDPAHDPGSTGDASARGAAVTPSEVSAPDPTAAGRFGGRRRRGHRRATGGTAPDAERALRADEWGAGPEALGSDAPDPREAVAESGHAQWLKQQRPPHWG